MDWDHLCAQFEITYDATSCEVTVIGEFLASLTANEVPAGDRPQAFRELARHDLLLEANYRPRRDVVSRSLRCLKAYPKEFADSEWRASYLEEAVRLHYGLRPAAGQSPFETCDLIARGQFGEVYRVTERGSGRIAAMKRLRPGARPVDRSRFFQEGMLLARIDCPHVVQVYGWALLEDGDVGLVMEFCENGTLEALIRPDRGAVVTPLSTAKVVLYILKICEGLRALHALGYVHRDLKPSNVLLDKNGHIKLADLGLAKDVNIDHRWTTQEQIGTLAYMAPEQFRTPSNVTASADVYSVGVMIFDLLTGRPPFIGTREEVERQIRELHVLPDLRTICPEAAQIPTELADAYRCCLIADPNQRYSLTELGEDLARFSSGRRPLRVFRDGLRPRRRLRVFRDGLRRRLCTHARALRVIGAVALFVLISSVVWAWVDREGRVKAELLAQKEKVVATALESASRAVDPITSERVARADNVADLASLQRDAALAGEQIKTAKLPLKNYDDLSDMKIKLQDQFVAMKAVEEEAERDKKLLLALQLAERELEMLSKHSDVEERHISIQSLNQERTYEGIFSKHGMNPTTPESIIAIAATIRASRLRWELVKALDHWLTTLKDGQSTGDQFSLLCDLADSADGDPNRSKIRKSLRTNGFDAVFKLSREQAMSELPVATARLFASALVSGNEPRECLEFLRPLWRQHGQQPWYHYSLGQSFFLLKDWPKAIDSYRLCLVLNPAHLAAQVNLSVAHERAGDYVEYEREARRALDISPSGANVHNNYGYALYLLKRYDAALRFFQSAIALNPHYFRPRANEVITLRLMGKMNQAIESCNLAVLAMPDDHNPYLLRARLLTDTTNHREIVANYELVLEKGGVLKLADTTKCVESYRALAMYPDMLRHTTRLMRQYPSVSAKGLYGTALVLMENQEEGLLHLESVANKVNNANYYQILGHCYYNLYRYDEALTHLKKAKSLHLAARPAELTAEWSMTLRDLEKLIEMTIACATKSREMLSGQALAESVEYRLQIARLHVATGKYSQAVLLYHQVAVKGLHLDQSSPAWVDFALLYACAAVKVSEAGETGPDSYSEVERDDWRQRAITSLQTEFVGLRRLSEDATKRDHVYMQLRRWVVREELSSVRDHLEMLPAQQRLAWGQFWNEVRGFLKETEPAWLHKPVPVVPRGGAGS